MSDKTIDVDRGMLVKFMNACEGKKYRFGGKMRINASPKSFNDCDCSAFVRWLIYNSTPARVAMPDGSFIQHTWCEKQGFKPTDYEQVAGLEDSRLRIAFIAPSKKKAGHVWLTINGLTIESYGDHGPGRRAWDCQPLLSRVSGCYVLSEPLP